MSDDPFHDWDAAYVLGLLGPDDRRAFEQHLTTCAACSTAVAELAGMPGILATLTKDEAVALLDPVDEPASDGLVTRLAVAAARRRRRVRLAVAGAGVAAALGLGIGGYVVGSANEPTSTGQFVAMDEVKPNTMTASLRVEKKDWGTRLDWNCQLPRHGRLWRQSDVRARHHRRRWSRDRRGHVGRHESEAVSLSTSQRRAEGPDPSCRHPSGRLGEASDGDGAVGAGSGVPGQRELRGSLSGRLAACRGPLDSLCWFYELRGSLHGGFAACQGPTRFTLLVSRMTEPPSPKTGASGALVIRGAAGNRTPVLWR